MPVDPGNLMLIATVRGSALIGAPGCARSPKENGFDWVLMRLLAGLPVSREDITGMGVGGLLMEIVTRPQPRTSRRRKRANASRPSCWPPAVPPAWARSTRCWRRSAASRWCASPPSRPWPRAAGPVIVVTGHQRDKVEAALARPRRAPGAQSGLRRRPRHVAAGRHRRGAGERRRRHRLPRRHAAGRRRTDRHAARRLRSGKRRDGRRADHRRAGAAIRWCGRGDSSPT